MNKEQLDKILDLHKKWLTLKKEGIRANLSGADLSRANLSRADLFGANLSGADLSRADLFRANLSGANLSGADLSRANLSGANLSRADLFGAILSRANLSDTIYENKTFKSFQYKQHLAYWDGYTLKIGCENHSLANWLKNYENIGKENNYSEKEIEMYGNFIKSLEEEQWLHYGKNKQEI